MFGDHQIHGRKSQSLDFVEHCRLFQIINSIFVDQNAFTLL